MSDQGILDGLKGQVADYGKAVGRKAMSSLGDQVDKVADRFEGGGGAAGEAAKEGAKKLAAGESPAKAAASAATTGAKDKIKGIFGGGSEGGGSAGFKFMNIVEWTDVGVPLSMAYNAFTEYESWPDFMKKVENVEWTDDVTLSIKGQVFWSHRTWEATITEQVADSHIVWESTGEKGHISGSVSFHEVTPTLTRMLTIGEYHPQGFMERTGNIWRAVGRRFRLELKFFVHHVMTDTILDPDSVEGWRGEIRDGELVTSHEDAVEEERVQADESAEEESPAAEDEDGSEGLAPEADSDEDAEEDLAEHDEPAEDELAEDEPAEDEPAEDEEPAEAEDADPEEEPPAEDEVEYEDEPLETDEDQESEHR